MSLLDPPPLNPLEALSCGLLSTVICGDSMTAQNAQVLTITSAVRTAGVVTVTTSAAHGLATGFLASTVNLSPSDFNIQSASVTVTSSTVFTYTCPGLDGSASALVSSAGRTLVMQAINLQRLNDNGYFMWMQGKTGAAFNMVVNAGCSGQNSGDMLARFSRDVLSQKAQLLVILTGYNDFANDHLSADAVYANVVSMISQARSRKMRVVVISALPWTTGGTTTDRAEAARYNRMIRAYCGTLAGVRYADAAKYIVNSVSGTIFSPVSGMLLSDGIHPTARAAERIAQAVVDSIASWVPSVSRLVSSNADNFGANSLSPNLFDYGPWSASGGSISGTATGAAATGFNITTSGTPTVVASTQARADGIGFDQQIVVTPSVASDVGRIGLSANIARGSVGDRIQLLAELSLSGVSGSSLKGVTFYLFFNGPNVWSYASQVNGVFSTNFPQSDMTITIASAATPIPSGTTSWNLVAELDFANAGSAVTMKLGRISVEKVS